MSIEAVPKDISSAFHLYTVAHRSSNSEVAVFVDESAYKYLTNCSLNNILHTPRNERILTGTPYDICDVYDFDEVYQNFKAVVLLSSAKTT